MPKRNKTRKSRRNKQAELNLLIDLHEVLFEAFGRSGDTRLIGRMVQCGDIARHLLARRDEPEVVIDRCDGGSRAVH